MISIENEVAARPASSNFSATKAWVRALELTAPIINHPQRILPTVIGELAEKLGEAPALLSARARRPFCSIKDSFPSKLTVKVKYSC